MASFALEKEPLDPRHSWSGGIASSHYFINSLEALEFGPNLSPSLPQGSEHKEPASFLPGNESRRDKCDGQRGGERGNLIVCWLHMVPWLFASPWSATSRMRGLSPFQTYDKLPCPPFIHLSPSNPPHPPLNLVRGNNRSGKQ